MGIADKARSKSLWIINYFNSCGFIELLPWVGAGYDMERFGMKPVGSPRHADVLLVAGYITEKGIKIVKRAYEQMPSPKYVVALGSCSMTGGMYWDSYSTVKHVDKYVPVDIWVPGCPPRPEKIGQAFEKLMKKIEDGYKGH